jgi:shikimate kinase
VSAEPNVPHLVFVGLAGSGKTTVGRGVAERLGRAFVDLDQEILQREGKSTVGEVFRSRGEAWFRRAEADLTRELAARPGMVIAPGGGWIMTPGSLETMRPVSYIIYLKVSPETALARIGSDRANRPLLDHPDPVGELRRQLEVRGPRYDEADIVVDSEGLDSQGVIEAVLSRIS